MRMCVCVCVVCVCGACVCVCVCVCVDTIIGPAHATDDGRIAINKLINSYHMVVVSWLTMRVDRVSVNKPTLLPLW